MFDIFYVVVCNGDHNKISKLVSDIDAFFRVFMGKNFLSRWEVEIYSKQPRPENLKESVKILQQRVASLRIHFPLLRWLPSAQQRNHPQCKSSFRRNQTKRQNLKIIARNASQLTWTSTTATYSLITQSFLLYDCSVPLTCPQNQSQTPPFTIKID